MLDVIEPEGLCAADGTEPEPLLETLIIEVVNEQKHNRLYALETGVGVEHARLDNGPCELMYALLSLHGIEGGTQCLDDLKHMCIGSSAWGELNAHCDCHEGECELILCDFGCPFVRKELAKSVLDGWEMYTAVCH